MKYTKKMLLSLLMSVFFIGTTFSQNFVTEANSIRNTIIANVDGASILYISELEGSVSAYTLDGKKLWRHVSQSPAIMFEIQAFDINNDGKDELLAASGDGHIYCWNTTGKLLWKFNPGHKVSFTEVAVVKQEGHIQIFAGGNDYTLYELDSKGTLVSETKIEGVVRKIEVGDFLEEGKQSIFLMTLTHDKYYWEFLGFLDPASKTVIKEHPYKKQPKRLWNRVMVHDVAVSDLDKDNKDDLLFYGTNFGVKFYAFNGEFNKIAEFQSKGGNQRYAHAIGTSLLPYKDEIVIQYGGMLYVLDSKGKILSENGKKYKGIIYNDLELDTRSKQLIAGGQIGGGNTIYKFSLEDPNWSKTKYKLEGRIADVENNLKELYHQTLNFKMPVYQKPSKKSWVMITDKTANKEVKKIKGNNFITVPQRNWKENTDRSPMVAILGDIALKKDRRMKYNLSREAIVKNASEMEAKGLPFTIWAGHGNDPFLLQIETMEAILEVAPTTCYGFIYAEMHNVEDPRVQYYIDEYVPRLAKACRKNGIAKLYFRYKNIFWAATSHQDPWKDMFFSGKYSDILIPSSEDTSSRTQDINLVGRVGMLAGGFVNDFAMRLVDDNPTSWRPYTPAGQRSVSPFLRQGVLMGAYGSRYGIIFNNKYLDNPGLNILYALMKSGVLPIVEKEDILSIGSWHLVDNVDKEFVHSVDDHHRLKKGIEKDINSVISVPQMHWAGTNLPDYDFSKAALGVNYRWNNYIPELPYGMIPMAPIEIKDALIKNNVPYFVSDGRIGYENGKPVSANQFGKNISNTVKKGASELSIVVSGASWSAIRLDDSHTRLILLDPGYLDPQDREATITFQNRIPKKVKDILSNEKLKVRENLIKLIVPAGSMRFIDITY